MTTVYLNYNGQLVTATFKGHISHKAVSEVFESENFQPEDNRFMLVYK